MRNQILNLLLPAAPFEHAWLTRPTFPRPAMPKPVPRPAGGGR